MSLFMLVRLGLLLITTSAQQQTIGDACDLPQGRSAGVCAHIDECPSVDRVFTEKRGIVWELVCGAKDQVDKKLIVCCEPGKVQRVTVSETACRALTSLHSRSNGPEQLIRNGSPAEEGEFPYLVALGYKSREKPSGVAWQCSGTLISDQWVMTAAHCIRQTLQWVRLGSLDLSQDPEVMLSIVEKVPHQNFSRGYNDIALLRLSRRLSTFNNKIWPGCLYQKDDVPLGNLTIVGYGGSGPTGKNYTEKLLKGVVTIMPLAECSRFFSRPGGDYNQGLNDNMFCARDPTGNMDTCQGDSGGPALVLDETIQIYFILGVTSKGSGGCARSSTSPTTYTKVARYLPWIEALVWPIQTARPVSHDTIMFPGRTN